MALMAAPRTPMRRRQRSARVTGAVIMLSVASAVVLLALPVGSTPVLALAAVAAVGLAWGGLRLMWTEVLQSRRENAADRAAAAAAYRNLFATRAAEHASFTAAMTARLAQANLAQRELEGQLVQHETRAQRAESKLAAESEALAASRLRVESLEQAIVALQDDGSVVDLAAWDEQVTAKTGRKGRSLKQA